MKNLPDFKPNLKGSLIDIDGNLVKFEIEKYVELTHSSNKEKKLVLQKLKFENGKKELRFGYYVIGRKPKMIGKWVWGQYSPFISQKDFHKLIEKARKTGML